MIEKFRGCAIEMVFQNSVPLTLFSSPVFCFCLLNSKITPKLYFIRKEQHLKYGTGGGKKPERYV